MSRAWPALAILFVGIARGAAPSYSAAGIVKAGSFAPGPFAPNSIVSIFGEGLARSTKELTKDDIVNHHLPTELNGTQVRISGFAQVPLFYVSDGQVNFLMPGTILKGPADIRVVRNGEVGPAVTVEIGEAAPALFVIENTVYAIAAHGDYSLITPESPARAGEAIVIYAAGLGKTDPMPTDGELPANISYLLNWKSAAKVMLNGVAVDAERMSYAGLTPTSAGLYQINLRLPDSVPGDPEIRVSIGDQTSQPGVKLALH